MLLHYITIIGMVLDLQLAVFIDYANTVHRTLFYCTCGFDGSFHETTQIPEVFCVFKFQKSVQICRSIEHLKAKCFSFRLRPRSRYRLVLCPRHDPPPLCQRCRELKKSEVGRKLQFSDVQLKKIATEDIAGDQNFYFAPKFPQN